VTEPATQSATELSTDVTLLRRFAALFVDWILCLLLSFGLGASPRNPGQWPVLILIAEYAFFIGLFAQTPGMAVAGIRCVSHANGGRIGVPRAALRGLLLALVIPALVMDESRRGWHDKAARSVIVRSRS
jgi:uncharacterized RDD family membrane protein YckC